MLLFVLHFFHASTQAVFDLVVILEWVRLRRVLLQRQAKLVTVGAFQHILHDDNRDVHSNLLKCTADNAAENVAIAEFL